MSEPARRGRAGFFMQVVPAVLYTFAIFYGGTAHPPSVPGPEITQADKLLHALAFGFMQLVVLRAVRFASPKWGLRTQNLTALALVVATGGLLELVQMTTSYRSADLLDWVADALGAATVAAFVDWYAGRAAPPREEPCAPPRERKG